jgi:hypothetical protein
MSDQTDTNKETLAAPPATEVTATQGGDPNANQADAPAAKPAEVVAEQPEGLPEIVATYDSITDAEPDDGDTEIGFAELVEPRTPSEEVTATQGEPGAAPLGAPNAGGPTMSLSGALEHVARETLTDFARGLFGELRGAVVNIAHEIAGDLKETAAAHVQSVVAEVKPMLADARLRHSDATAILADLELREKNLKAREEAMRKREAASNAPPATKPEG